MTRSVKDLRELICVSRLSMREGDEDDEYDLSRPLTSLSIYGEPSADSTNRYGDHYRAINSHGDHSVNRITNDGFAVPRPPSSSHGGSRARSAKRPQSAHSKSLSDTSSFNFRQGTKPLPPVGGGSRPSSSSSSGSDNRPGSGETPQNNYDNVLQYLREECITEWLQRTTDMLNELTEWCEDPDHFVDFAQFWLTEFPDSQRLQIYKLEISIIADELVAAFGDSYRKGQVRPSDISGLLSSVLKEYPTKLCSAQGSHIFLDILDTITSQKTQAYKRLLTDTNVSTRNGKCAQCLLALRAFSLVSVWNSIVLFYRRVHEESMGAAGGETSPNKKPPGTGREVGHQRLFLAIKKGYVSVIHYYLRNGRVKTDVRDDQGRTLTFAAVMANQSSVLHYLITKHKDALPVNQPGESGNTPLHTAANWNYVNCIQVLISKGNADVNVTNPQCDNATPLHVAVMQGHRESSEVLVYAGADATASMNGITPLELARDMGHEDIYKMLLGKLGVADYSEEAMDV